MKRKVGQIYNHVTPERARHTTCIGNGQHGQSVWLIVVHMPGKHQLEEMLLRLAGVTGMAGVAGMAGVKGCLSSIVIVDTRRLTSCCESLLTAVLAAPAYLSVVAFLQTARQAKIDVRLANNNVHSLRSHVANPMYATHDLRGLRGLRGLRVAQKVWLIFSYGILANNHVNHVNHVKQSNQTNQLSHVRKTFTPNQIVQLFQTAITASNYSLYDEFDETNQVAQTKLSNVKFVAVKLSRNPTHTKLLGKGKRWRACDMFCNVLATASIGANACTSHATQCLQDLAELLSHHVASVGEGWLVEQLAGTKLLASQIQICQI